MLTFSWSRLVVSAFRILNTVLRERETKAYGLDYPFQAPKGVTYIHVKFIHKFLVEKKKNHF